MSQEFLKMKKIRKRQLPEGWYPSSPEKIRDFLRPLPQELKADAVIAPHAGWFYAGKIAGRAIAALNPDAETVAVLGGHLSAERPFRFFEEDGLETPLGILPIDTEFRDLLMETLGKKYPLLWDPEPDNTIEVLLPMIAYFFPKAQILPFRLPGTLASFQAGEIVAGIASALQRKVGVVGSTDLTHYGKNYRFAPRGYGKPALEWMKTVNDRAFIDALLEGVPETILARAEQDYSACSVGAVLGALGFAQARGAVTGTLLCYGTSAEAPFPQETLPDSFVGYGAAAWTCQS
jgi:AmmeMemoRadiSam system protein B